MKIIYIDIALLFIIIIAAITILFMKNPIKKSALTNLPQSKIKPMMNQICIFMIATPEIMNYASYTIENNKEYAHDKGYDFFVFGQLTPDLPINFSKLQATLDLMDKGYQYIMHIDADAIIDQKNYYLEHIIEKYITWPTSFIASEDCYNYKICSKPGHINSGVYIVKNDFFGKKIIQTWLNSARNGKCKKYVHKFPNCQLVFSHCLLNSMYRPFIKIVEYNVLNGIDGLFIKHLMQHSSRDRIDTFKKYNKNWKKGTERLKVY